MSISRRVYLDHAATTPVIPEVADAMRPYMTEMYGNASSLHSFGQEAKRALDSSRDALAAALGADASEIYFTSGGTESDNQALVGVSEALTAKGNHIVTTSIEHHAVLETCAYLKSRGIETTLLPVDRYGMVDPTAVEEAITDRTILVSVMHANNEIGTIQPIAEIAKITRSRGVLLHTDAVQTVGHIPVNVDELGVDLLSLSAHKLHGPKGIGALYARRGTRIGAIIHGGAQERQRRAGTENVPAIVGMAEAVRIALAGMPETMARETELRDYLIEGILSRVRDVTLNGHPTQRLPGNVSMAFRHLEGESLVLTLDLKGIAASSGSACASGAIEPSHVLSATGLPFDAAHGALRLTLGRGTTREDLDYVIETLPPTVERLRSWTPRLQ